MIGWMDGWIGFLGRFGDAPCSLRITVVIVFCFVCICFVYLTTPFRSPWLNRIVRPGFAIYESGKGILITVNERPFQKHDDSSQLKTIYTRSSSPLLQPPITSTGLNSSSDCLTITWFALPLRAAKEAGSVPKSLSK